MNLSHSFIRKKRLFMLTLELRNFKSQEKREKSPDIFSVIFDFYEFSIFEFDFKYFECSWVRWELRRRWWRWSSIRERITAICFRIYFKLVHLLLTGLIIELFWIRTFLRNGMFDFLSFFGRWCENGLYMHVSGMFFNRIENRMSSECRRDILRNQRSRCEDFFIVCWRSIWIVFLHFDLIEDSLAAYFDELKLLVLFFETTLFLDPFLSGSIDEELELFGSCRRSHKVHQELIIHVVCFKISLDLE